MYIWYRPIKVCIFLREVKNPEVPGRNGPQLKMSFGLVKGAGEWLWNRTARESQFSPHSPPWERSTLSPKEREGQTEGQRQQPAVS